jgi:restriction system protein
LLGATKRLAVGWDYMADIIIFLSIVFLALLLLVFGFIIGSQVSYKYKYSLIVNQNQSEAKVRKIIISYFSAQYFYLLNNVTIPRQDGTTQIDHILVSTKGIFVLETKNYSGWIYGDEKSKQWTSVHYKIKNRFQNPIHQNFLHLKSIIGILDFIKCENIHSLIVFTGTATIKTQVPKNVIGLNQLIAYLGEFSEGA